MVATSGNGFPPFLQRVLTVPCNTSRARLNFTDDEPLLFLCAENYVERIELNLQAGDSFVRKRRRALKRNLNCNFR